VVSSRKKSASLVIQNMKKFFCIVSLFFLFKFGFAQAIFSEGFESTTFPPTGWNVIDISGTKNWARSTVYAHSGNASAEHGWLAGSVQATALVTPPITLPNYGTSELDFWSRIQLVGYNQSSKILISTTVNNDINAFTLVKILEGDEVTIAAWKNIVIPLDAYMGQTIYIAFLYTADNGPYWYIDDIKVNHFASFVDIQPFGITPISNDYPLFSSNEKITVRIKNNGGAPASGFNLKLFDNGNLLATEPFSGAIPSLGEATYTFNTKLNLSAAGMHKVQVVTNLTGDQIPANDTATSKLNNLGCEIFNTFPYVEGFESNGNNLPLCWTQECVAENYKWKVYNAASAQYTTFEPKTAFEGEYKAVFYTNGKDGAITKLLTPPLNITTMSNPVLKFHHIQQFYAGDQDSLKVYYRTGAYEPWILLEKYTETIDNWTERIIPLPEPSSQYYIAFEAYAEYGYSVQIDAITIEDYVDKDIAVKEITPKGVHFNLTEQESVLVTIKNNGRNPVSGFNVSLFVNESLISKEVFSGTISGLGEAVYTFNTKIDLSVSGTYSLSVVAELEGDEVPENDELTVFVSNIICDALTFPYEEGFEEDMFPPPCWFKIGEWKKTPYGAHTGNGRASYAWWDGSLGWLISPKLSIPAYGNFMLEFWSYIYEKKFFSYSGVWISTTNSNPSSFTEILSLSGDLTPDEVWKKIEIPLTQYAGMDIFIAFKYTNSGGQSGHMWSVDDIKIYNLNNYIDVELTEIITPPSFGINLTSEEPVTVKIKNNGTDKVSGFSLFFECYGTSLTHLSAEVPYIGYINSMASVNYTFSEKLNLSAEDIYNLKVTIVLEEDIDPDNNFKTKTVENTVTGISDINGSSIPLTAWIYNDLMYISGLIAGTRFEVYSATGLLIYQTVAQSDTESTKLNTRGVYIVKSGSKVLKVVY